MKVKLIDGAPRSKAEAVLIVSKNGNTLEVGLEGTVPPVVIEYYEGRARLRVYGEDETRPIFMFDLVATPLVTPETETAAAAPALATEPTTILKPAPVANSFAEGSDPADDEMAAFDAA